MVFQDVDFSLRTAFVDFVAILTIVVLGCLDDRHFKLWHRIDGDVGVALDQVINQHPSALES